MADGPAGSFLSRRAFAVGGLAAATGVVSLHVLGCGRGDDPIGAKLPRRPIRLTRLDRFLAPGVYSDLTSSNIWLYSDGAHLVALAAVCTHQGCVTKFNPMIQQYVCPCHGSRYSVEGLVKGSSRAKRSLERLRIVRVGGPDSDEAEIDPNIRYVMESNQWSVMQSMLPLRISPKNKAR